MRLFVTGATGFIGSYFLRQSLRAGHAIVALRRSPDSKTRIELESEPDWLEKSLENVTPEDLKNIDVVVHLAAAGVTPQPATWENCYTVNVLQSLHLFQISVQANVKRFVVTGTYAEYGNAGLRFDPIPVDAPLEPTDAYASSKASSSIALASFCRSQKIELSYLRLFSVFGEGQFENNFWPALRRAAISGQDYPMTLGEQIRDFISVEEVAHHLISACLRSDINPGELVFENIGSGKPQTLRHFAEYWWNKWGATGNLLPGKIAYRKDEVMKYVPEIKKW